MIDNDGCKYGKKLCIIILPITIASFPKSGLSFYVVMLSDNIWVFITITNTQERIYVVNKYPTSVRTMSIVCQKTYISCEITLNSRRNLSVFDEKTCKF